MAVSKPTPRQIQQTLEELQARVAHGRRITTDVMLMDYQTEYLNSSLWRRIKKRVLARDKNICVFCGGSAQTVHHRSYDRDVLEGSADNMLVSLCDACHEFIHFDDDGGKRRVEETDELLLRKQPPTHFPEPNVDLRREIYSQLPAEWPRMNHLQRNGWLTRYKELRKLRRAALKANAAARAMRRRRYAWDPHSPWIPLFDAVNRYREEDGAPSNSYYWYRACAMRSGLVHIGDSQVKAEKRNRVWHVEAAGFAAAISSHRERRIRVAKNTADYANHVIHGKDGERIETTWGYYENHGKFRFEFSLHECLRARSDGVWRCNSCHEVVEPHSGFLSCRKCEHSDQAGT